MDTSSWFFFLLGKKVEEIFQHAHERKVPVDEEDCDGNEKNDENRDSNGPGRDSCFARRTIWTDWEILC